MSGKGGGQGGNPKGVVNTFRRTWDKEEFREKAEEREEKVRAWGEVRGAGWRRRPEPMAAGAAAALSARARLLRQSSCGVLACLRAAGVPLPCPAPPREHLHC